MRGFRFLKSLSPLVPSACGLKDPVTREKKTSGTEGNRNQALFGPWHAFRRRQGDYVLYNSHCFYMYHEKIQIV